VGSTVGGSPVSDSMLGMSPTRRSSPGPPLIRSLF
jgi:hypothetical protein